MFGYYLEVTHTHTGRVPADYERRQTLSTAERYVTPELKDYEARVLGAEERMGTREAELFGALRGLVAQAIERIQRTARVLARLDVWAGLAERAVAGRYVRPEITDGFDLTLKESRHPVIERMMQRESVHSQRCPLYRGGAGGPGHRAQHGREIHHPPADRPVRGAGPDRLVRARRRGVGRGRRPPLHPGRRQRQSRRRASPPSWWR